MAFLYILLSVLSLIIVAFGQPAWTWWTGLLASVIGFALFFRVLLDIDNYKKRFLCGTLWFAAVQWIQLYWLTSHPYFYAYFIQLFFAVLWGMQFGLLALFITPAILQKLRNVFALAALWTICEWARLFFMSGYSWNPIGIALTGSIYSLQMASLWGVFGLSFWVMVVNLLAVRLWIQPLTWRTSILFAFAALTPYFYGIVHLSIHQEALKDHRDPTFHALLVQTAFPAEEAMNFIDRKQMTAHIINEWKQVLRTVKPHLGKKIDLMVMPEYIVPGGTYTFIYPHEAVKEVFSEVFGDTILQKLPISEEPFVRLLKDNLNLTNNAFWAQALANIFNSGVVLGLEDAEDLKDHREFYSAAMYFRPESQSQNGTVPAERYEKRVLVPLGEYIPFDWCRALAASYGVNGSFTPGREAKIFTANGKPFGLSICYEETFGNLMRENKHLGAGILVNLTSDVWYPHSRLPMQHFTHSRLRTVESGIPLIRASNMGITGAIDSLGNILAVVEEHGYPSEHTFEALDVAVPMYTYQTIYGRFGDALIICFSLLLVLYAALQKKVLESYSLTSK